MWIEFGHDIFTFLQCYRFQLLTNEEQNHFKVVNVKDVIKIDDEERYEHKNEESENTEKENIVLKTQITYLKIDNENLKKQNNDKANTIQLLHNATDVIEQNRD